MSSLIHSPLSPSVAKKLLAKVDFDSAIRGRHAENLKQAKDELDEALELVRSLPHREVATVERLKDKLSSSILAKLPDIIAKAGLAQNDMLREAASSKIMLDFLASTVMKPPGKQGIHQAVASSHLEKNLMRTCVAPLLLPVKGPKAIVAYNHKSIDFSWCYKLYEFVLKALAGHKHTEMSGGAQDNQYNDMMAFVKAYRKDDMWKEEEKKKGDKDRCFVRYYAIADGEYYQRSSRAIAPLTLMEKMRQGLASSSPVRILTVNDVALQWALDVGEFADHVGRPLPPADAEVVRQARRIRDIRIARQGLPRANLMLRAA